MGAPTRAAFAPTDLWQEPATTWLQILDRYISYLQVPAWRVNAFTRKGEPTRACMAPATAARLQAQMRQVADRIASRRSVDAVECLAAASDLTSLQALQGRGVTRTDRCSKALCWHFQRAFLLNAAGYTCVYCRRSAWSVYGERVPDEAPRTLRFEIDHQTPTRRANSRKAADAISNLVIACRSCNTIKGEMEKGRFLAELRSLARATQRLEDMDP